MRSLFSSLSFPGNFTQKEKPAFRRLPSTSDSEFYAYNFATSIL